MGKCVLAIKMGRKKIDRTPIFRMLALNWDKKKIKREAKISERTYWMIKAKYNQLTDAMKKEIKSLATEEEKAKAKFEDYEFVQRWIGRMQSERIKSWKSRFNKAKRVWLILQKKNPENWTLEDDIKLKAVPKLRARCPKGIFQYLVALRSLRPDFKFPDKKGQVLTTKREKGKVAVSWKYLYQRIVQEGLVQKFFESAKGENPLRDETLVRTHVTLGCREGSKGVGGILNLEWEKVNWKAKSIDVYEGKTGGGFYWLDCPLDLFGDTCFNMLREYWVQCGQPKEGRIFPIDYPTLKGIYARISKALDMKINPHFARKLHASLLRKQGIKLEVVSGEAPHGIVGVGWEDLTTLKKFYIAFAQDDIQKAKEKARELAL